MANIAREPTPLYIQTLRHYPAENDNNDASSTTAVTGDDGGRYETVQKLITPSPLHKDGEIETSLQQFVQRDGSILWRRVVVKNGPSTAQPAVTHASFLLPDDYHPNDQQSVSSSNSLCWASFAEQPPDSPPMLCVLAHPTLLCIWDVYPSSNHGGNTGEGHYVSLPFEASGIFALDAENKKHTGLLLQRCETVEDLYAFDLAQQQKQKHGNDDEEDEDDHDHGFVLKAPPRLGRESGASSLPSLHVSTPEGDAAAVNVSTVTMTNAAVPSLFSLSHPQGDVLPVSTRISEEDATMMGPFTDVFEKILWVDTMRWVDEDKAWLERKQHSQPICVTYHTQLKR
jgi:Anaphase-promoting complex subunit 1